MKHRTARILVLVSLTALICASLPGAATPTTKKKAVAKTAAKKKRPVRTVPEPPYDATTGDVIDGEDLTVRRAAVEALGPRNGTVVVVDPSSGKVLSIVNQKMALATGFKPCSTIKLVAALAALSEGMIERSTKLRLSKRVSMDLTEAIAHSNNPYFAQLGMKLGFDRVNYYARLFGLGEKAGLNIDGEEPGVFPSTPIKEGNVGMMTSFGTGIGLTPLQLASLMSAIANGGTLYYLQYPHNPQETENFVPRVKRHLDIQPFIPAIRPGMMGAVEYGTAKRAAYDPNEPIFGKTGTCNDYQTSPTHLGWFGAFNETGKNKLVVVVLVKGRGSATNGPLASQIAGAVFKTLSQQSFASKMPGFSPASLVASGSCCGQ